MNPLGLTDREVVIAWAYCCGRDRSWLAHFLGLSCSNIREQENRLRWKLGARSMGHAAITVLREIISMEEAPGESRVRSAFTQAQLVAAVRRAVKDNAIDPELALSYVIWPPESLKVAA